jgi:hypothetical protein
LLWGEPGDPNGGVKGSYGSVERGRAARVSSPRERPDAVRFNRASWPLSQSKGSRALRFLWHTIVLGAGDIHIWMPTQSAIVPKNAWMKCLGHESCGATWRGTP